MARNKKNQTEKQVNVPKKKKKKRGCLGCFLAFIIINVVFTAALLGVGYGVGNKYSKQYLGVTLPQAIKVASALTKGDRDKIITNAPTEADEASFYGVLDDVLLLRDGTIDKESLSLLTDSLTSSTSDDGESQDVVAARLAAESGDVESSLFSLINRENADVEKLARFDASYDYSASYDADFVAVINDRQLMALVKSMLDEKLSSASGTTGEILQYLSFDQLVLSRSGDDKPEVALTASIGARALVGEKLGSVSEIPGFAKKLVKKITPKEIFVEVKITMGDTNSAVVNINGMSEAKHSNAMKIADGILKLTGAKKSAQETIDGFVNDYAGNFISLADDMLHFGKNVQSDGKLKLDLFGALATTLFEDSELRGEDLALAYSSVLRADAEKLLAENENSMFENEYIDYREEFLKEFSAKYLMRTNFYRESPSSTKAYLQPAYKGADSDDAVYSTVDIKQRTSDGELPVDEEGRPYDTLYLDGDDKIKTIDEGNYKPLYLLEYVELSFSDVAALMGVGESEKVGNVELQTLFDPSGMRKALYQIDGEVPEDENKWFVNQARTVEENPDENLTFMLDERMLGALVNEQMEDIITGENELLSSLKLRWTGLQAVDVPETVELTETVDEVEVPTGNTMIVKRSYMTVGFSASTASVFGENELFPSLTGETLSIAVRVEITPELEDKYLGKPLIYYADLGANRTAELLDAMERANLSQFDVEMINEQIGKPIRNVIKTMQEKLGGVTVATGTMHIPDAFQLIKTQMLPYDETKVYKGVPIEITADELHEIMKDLYDLPPVEYVEYNGREYHFLTNGSEEVDGVREFKDVYDAVEYFPQDDSTHGESINHDNFPQRVINLNQMYKIKDNPALSALVRLPALSADLGEAVGYYDSDHTEAGYEFFTFEYHISDYLEGADSNASLLDIDTIFATFRVDKEIMLDKDGNVTTNKSEAKRYHTTLILNTMDESTKENLLKLIVYLSTDPEDSKDIFSDVEKQIGELAYLIDHNEYAHEFIQYGTIGGQTISA